LDLVEGSTFSKKEKETTGRAEAGNVETPAPQTLEKKKRKANNNNNAEGIDKIYQETTRDELALRREQM
jgi:hypothetical protein